VRVTSCTLPIRKYSGFSEQYPFDIFLFDDHSVGEQEAAVAPLDS
jgi:hypothetical protein